MSLSKERLIKFSSTIMSRTTMAQTNISFISNMLGIFKLESDTIDSNFDFDRFIADKEKLLNLSRIHLITQIAVNSFLFYKG